MSRTVIDLDARATVLDAAERLTEAPPDGDVALVVAAGAPLLRNAVFLDVLRGLVGPRRLSIVTADARARSVASSAHVPAYASLAALERRELDPTERLTPARRAAIATMRTAEAPRVTTGRVLGVIGSLLGATLVLLAVVLPEARVVVAPTVLPIGPVEVEVRAGGSGEIGATVLTAQITARLPITAGGQRVVETRATGILRLRNKTTSDVDVPRGSVFSTAGGVQFLSTEERSVPRSVIVPGTSFELFVGQVDVPVEAAVAGDPGNVGAGTVVNGPRPDRYTVTNDAPMTGGQITRIPVMRAEDYDAALAAAPEALRAEAQKELDRWVATPQQRQGVPLQVIQQVLVSQSALGPARVDVVGKEVASLEMTVSGTARAYAVSVEDFRGEVLETLAEEHLPPGRTIAEGTALIEPKSVTVTDEGVTWAVVVSAAHMNPTTRDAIARALAGRPAGEVEAILAAQDLRLGSLDRAPSWWPLMPLLDGRISVSIAAASVTQGR